MKRVFVFIFILGISNYLFSELTRTITMDSTQVSNLRSAVTNGSTGYDAVMDQYYDKINPGSTRYEGEDSAFWRDDPVRYAPIGQVGGYATQSFLGVINEELNTFYTNYLNNAKRFLLDPSFNDYLNLDSLWVNIDERNISTLRMGDVIYGVASIVDNLWYYPSLTQTERDSLYNILDNIVWGFNEAIKWDSSGGDTRVYPDNPADYGGLNEIKVATSMDNKRIYLVATLGYAACVLNNTEYITTVEEDLFNINNHFSTHQNFTWPDGLIDFMSGNGGIYAESMEYSGLVLGALNSFFTARKRLYGINHFEDSRIRSLYTESLHLLAPDFSSYAIDDAYTGQIEQSGDIHILSNPEVIGYYYQGNPTSEERAEIEWLMQGYYQEYGEFPKYWQERHRIYSYNSDYCNAFSTLPSTPQSIAQGSYNENSEFSILRPEINSISEFRNAPTLFVNHENSAPYSSHEHSDQSSFVLYYKGKQLLIDPGYLPSRKNYDLAKEWLASPYAHNLVIVNPLWGTNADTCGYYVENELFEDYQNIRTNAPSWLSRNNEYDFNYYAFEPVGRCYYPYPDFPSSQYSVGLPDSPLIPKNPAVKNYLLVNDNAQPLQVGLNKLNRVICIQEWKKYSLVIV